MASLDEDFVRGARVQELSAAERAEEAKAFKKADRKIRRRHRGRRALAIIVPVAIVGGIVAFSTRQRPTDALAFKPSVTTVASVSSTDRPPVATTTVLGTTTISLNSGSYAVGECVRWDQEGSTRRRDVHTVSCDSSHLFEMVGMTVVPQAWTAGPRPTGDQSFRMIEAACRGLAERFYGGPLDPYGFVHLAAISPLEDGWLAGDRNVGCALTRLAIDRSDIEAYAKDRVQETVGSLRTSDQRFPWKVGDCLTFERWTFRVPCAEPHTYEFVGWGEFPKESERPFATNPTYGDTCDALAQPYQPDPAESIVMWDQVTSESWAAGTRSFPCYYASAKRDPDGSPAKRVGSVRVVTV
jgi:Septum formation